MTLHITGAVRHGNWCLSETINPFQLLRNSDFDAYKVLESYLCPIAKGNKIFGKGINPVVLARFQHLKPAPWATLPVGIKKRQWRLKPISMSIYENIGFCPYYSGVKMDVMGYSVKTMGGQYGNRSRYRFDYVDIGPVDKFGEKGIKKRLSDACVMNGIIPKKSWTAKRMYQALIQL